MPEYRIFTDATADMCPEMLEDLPPVEIIPMQLEIGGSEYSYGPVGTITAEKFYRLQRAGNFARTSQINPCVYFEHFEPCLRQGLDIIYLGFSSGMSGTLQTARLCAEELRQEFPERKIICIDTLCASVGEGFLVREAARRQRELDDVERLMQEILAENPCFSLAQLAANGRDMTALGLTGPAVGKMLRRLLSEVMSGKLENDRETLLRRAQQLTEK